MPELITKKNFISYIIAKLRSTSLWNTFCRIIVYARRFLLVGRIFHYISVAFAIIETSAVLILAAAAAAVLLPAVIVSLTAVYIAELIRGSRIFKSSEFKRFLSRDHIYIIGTAGNFGEGFARELSENGAAVFIITSALDKKFIAAKMTDGICYIRHSFFFRLKRRVLSKHVYKLIYLI